MDNFLDNKYSITDNIKNSLKREIQYKLDEVRSKYINCYCDLGSDEDWGCHWQEKVELELKCQEELELQLQDFLGEVLSDLMESYYYGCFRRY